MASDSTPVLPPSDGGFIYRPYIKLPNGKVIWARNYGLKAFKIPVSADARRAEDKN